MKITMYELLGMVKDGNAPKKIKTGNIVYELASESNIWADEVYHEENKDYIWLNFKHIKSLNDTVEIIEEEKKIPEKLTDILRVDDLVPPVNENMYKIWTQTIKNHNKINEICDYLKSKGE